MHIKTYQAIDMAEAIARIKADLGPNAIIMGSRKIKNPAGGYGILGRPFIEVTAAADEEVRQDQQQQRRRQQRRHAPHAKPESSAAGTPETLAAALDPLRDEIRQLRELVGAAADTGAVNRNEMARAAGLSEDVGSLRSMMAFMLENTRFYKGLNLEPNYLVCYRRLVERGVEHEYALKLMTEVKDGVPGGRELDLKNIVDLVIGRIQETMIVGEPLTAAAEGPRVIALIGPTGVGKTTTLAKVAAQLAMQGKKVGLITIDTYRIAAVEQLRTYAQILGLPLEVALTPQDMPKALNALAGRDVILIDTAGRSQRDGKKLAELAGFVGDASIENYLVLSAAADAASLDEAVRNFGCVNIAGLIFTKLDESAKPGVVVTQNYKTGLPVVYCTTGQRVPEDIEAASGRRIGARLFKKEA